MDTPTELGKYLGCTHTSGTLPISTANSINEWRSDVINQALADLGHPNLEKPPAAVNTMAYDMRDFVGQCVERYCELANITRSTLRSVATPSIDIGVLQDEDFTTRATFWFRF